MNRNNPLHNDYMRDETPEIIAQLLTQATKGIPAETVDALQHSRNIALAHQSAHKPAFALVGNHGIHLPTPHSAQQWLYVAILLTTILVSLVGYWHHEQDTSHLDIAILTDDLPMEIFVDR